MIENDVNAIFQFPKIIMCLDLIIIQKLLMAKRIGLIEKLDDAKSLKDGIDRRSEAVDGFLKASLSESEYAAYQDLVSAIIRLHFLHQWTEDRQLRCERQLKALNATLVKSGSTQY